MIPLILPEKTENPLILFLVFYLSPIISLFVSYIIFPESPSLPFIFLSLLCSFPYIYYSFEKTVSSISSFFERLEIEDAKRRVNDIILRMIIFFLSTFSSFLTIFLALPQNLRKKFFEQPLSLIPLIKGGFSDNTFLEILANNFFVLIATFFISLIYITGSSFVVLWNSSILACIIGELIIFGENLKIIGYFMHGFPEILSYILSGISGSIIALSFSKRYEEHVKMFFLKISVDLLILAIILLILAAGIEVSISPFFIK